MALVVKDRVREVTTTTGTSDFTLGGAVLGYQSFSVIGNGNQTYYAVQDSINGDWEVGIGTYSTTGPTLSRDTVLESSNGGSKVVFAAGSKDVFCTYPAERSVYLDTTGAYTEQIAFNSLTANSAVLLAGTIAAVPSSGTDIANKAYVDTTTVGLTIHAPVVVVSTSNLNATYADGGTTPSWTTITSNSQLSNGTAHGLSVNDVIVFANVGASGLTAGQAYFVKSTPSATAITLSLIKDGPTITTLTNGASYSITSRANSGVGATLTNAGTKAALTIDGVALSATQRVLVQGQTSAFQNGVYTVTTVGTPDPGGTNWVLTRASNENRYDPRSDSGLGSGDYFFVTSGSTGKGDSYVLSTTGTLIFGTTNLTFSQFSESDVYSAGTGLSLSSLTFSIANTGVSAATYGSASSVPTIAVNAQGQITSASNTAIAIAAGAVSGLAASATTDTTNASNITTGTLPTGRLSGSYTGITGVGTLTAGTWNAGTIGVPYGGTGITSYAVGDLLYADTTTSLAKLADVATGNALISGGVGTAPAWGKIGLTTHVSGTLPVSNGGTGATTLTGYVYGNGTGAFTASTSIPNSATTATSANTASAIVARDASGNFSAGTITASLSGNATTATSATSATTATNLAGGVAGALPYQSGSGATAFSAAGTSGQYLQSNGTSAPSWITPPTIGNGTLTMSVAGTGLSGSATFTANQAGNSTFTVTSNATSANTASTIVARDASGNFSAGTITATVSGSATSVSNSVTFNNSGTGDASGTTFNGSAARTISYNTIGASPLAGSASLTTTGTVTSGTWSASFGAVSGANLTNLTAGNLTGTIPSAVLGNSSLNVGTTSIALNRASANQALTGISSVTFPGATSGTVQLIPAATAGTGTVLTMPATTGTVITSGDTGTVTSTMILDGTIVNADINASAAIAVSKLAASTISGVTLGNNLNTLTLNVSGTGLSGSTTYNGSAAATFTVTSNATNANTASTIVARDASGNFSAGTITAALSGNASTSSDSSLLNGISAVNLYNNMGQIHPTRTAFDATTPSYGFGYRFVQGSTNGPGTGGSQYYSWYIGLGSEYPATGAGSYGAMFAVDRNTSTPYLSVRFNESNSFTAWYKIRAGYADSSGSVANSVTFNNGGAGGASGSTFNGASALTVSYNTVGAPSTTGTNASGTWGISISGNAATATTASNVNNGTLTLAVSGTGLSGSASFTANQSGNSTFTVTSNATNANTASTIVARDASGNFSAGTITAALSGNASTASRTTGYTLNETGGTAAWLYLGEWSSAPQAGAKLNIRIVCGQGYNATNSQNQITDIFFKTSNGTSAQSGSTGSFFGDGMCWRTGPNTASPSVVRVIQVSSTQYQIYGLFSTFTGGNSFYLISAVSGTWTHSGAAVTPSGNYIDLPIYQTLDSSNYNSYSPTLAGTGATGIWGISITGNAATATSATTATNIAGGSAGQIPYQSGAGATTFTSNLFYDATNIRLGVGTSSPVTRLHVQGGGVGASSARLESTGTLNSSIAILDFYRSTTTSLGSQQIGSIQWSRLLTDSTSQTPASILVFGSNVAGSSAATMRINSLTQVDLQVNSSTIQTVSSAGISINGSVSSVNTFRYKNRIINGDMRIDQRNNGASVTQTSGYAYGVDRWGLSGTQSSKLSAQRNAGSVTPPAGFTNYLGITSLSAYTVTGNDLFTLEQVIEGFNVADLDWGTANAKACTLSFWVRSSLTGTFGGSIATTKTAIWVMPFTYTISVANTWTFVTVSVTAPTSTGGANTDNTAGVYVRFGLGSSGIYAGGTAGVWTNAGNYLQPTGTVSVVGTNGATFYVTGVQFEIGSTATGFDFLDITTQLSLCQRYYQKNRRNNGIWISAQNLRIVFPYLVEMRANPSLGILNFNAYHELWNLIGYNGISSISVGDVTTVMSDVVFVSSANRGRTYADPALMDGNVLQFSAEL